MSAWVVRRENSAGGVHATRAAPRRSMRHALRPRPDNLPGSRPSMRLSSESRPPEPWPQPPPWSRPPEPSACPPVPRAPWPPPGAPVAEPPGVPASARTAPARAFSRRLRHIPSHLRAPPLLAMFAILSRRRGLRGHSAAAQTAGRAAEPRFQRPARATTAAHAGLGAMRYRVSGPRGRPRRPIHPIEPGLSRRRLPRPTGA
jgi:hypothetical protein